MYLSEDKKSEKSLQFYNAFPLFILRSEFIRHLFGGLDTKLRNVLSVRSDPNLKPLFEG